MQLRGILAWVLNLNPPAWIGKNLWHKAVLDAEGNSEGLLTGGTYGPPRGAAYPRPPDALEAGGEGGRQAWEPITGGGTLTLSHLDKFFRLLLHL